MSRTQICPEGRVGKPGARWGWGVAMATVLSLMLLPASARAVTTTLTINTPTGSGSGTVTSDIGGISCPGTCSADYPPDTLVTLTATANPGSGFVQWSGACTGTARTCQVTLDTAKIVGAQFNLPTPVSTVSYGTNVTWPLANSPYVVTGAVTVNAGSALTIEPGVIVKFVSSSGLIVNGTLQAVGTSESPIVFTDSRDDTAGGDTNGDGNATSPTATWAGIYMYGGSTGVFDRCSFTYGGNGWYGGNSYGEIYKTGAGNLSVTHSAFSASQYWTSSSIYLDGATGPVNINSNILTGGTLASYDGIYVQNSGNSVTIGNNTIQNFRNHGVELKNSSPNIGANSFTGNNYYGIYTTGVTSLPAISADNTYSGNGSGPLAWDVPAAGNAHLYDATLPSLPTIVDSYGGAVNSTVAVDTTWKSERPYWFKVSPTVNTGVTLTIQSVTNTDIITKWQGTLVVNGNLQVIGTSAHKVYLTDYRDDSLGGDTNGNGASTVPATNGWGGITVNGGGTASIDYADIRYGGTNNAALYKTGAGAVSLTNSSISSSAYWGEGISLNGTTGPITISGNAITGGGSNNAYDGISLQNAGNNVTINGNIIQNNRRHGVVLKNSSPTISNNTITGNSYYGLYLIEGSLPSVTGTTFSGNTLGYMAFDVTAAANAHLYDATFPGQPVIVDYVGGSGSLNVAVDTTWQSERSYWFKSSPSINAGVTLTLKSVTNKDIVTKWQGTALVVNGNLLVVGTAAHRVYMTDYRDDSVGGDTNGDGASVVPASSGWGGVTVNAGGTASIDYADIRYGGSANAALYKTGAGAVSLTNSTISFRPTGTMGSTSMVRPGRSPSAATRLPAAVQAMLTTA